MNLYICKKNSEEIVIVESHEQMIMSKLWASPKQVNDILGTSCEHDMNKLWIS